MVEVWKSREKAHYKNLQTCGSVWICPVCAAKISERRRVELVQGIETWTKAVGAVLMITLTVPHYQYHPLKEVLEGFGKARRLMRHRKPWKRLTRNALDGTVRALEVTHGENGWHVHSHEILFIKPGLVVKDELGLQSEIFFMWLAACRTAGLGKPNFRNGVQVQDGQQAGKYAAKWGMDCELTKGHIKQARGEGNYSPWDMLREYGKGGEGFEDHFREYARAFKGKRQLVWSDGMRDLAGLGAEASDEELAARVEMDAVFLGALDRMHWRQVTEAEKRGELLEIAAASGWEGVKEFIRGLVKEI